MLFAQIQERLLQRFAAELTMDVELTSIKVAIWRRQKRQDGRGSGSSADALGLDRQARRSPEHCVLRPAGRRVPRLPDWLDTSRHRRQAASPGRLSGPPGSYLPPQRLVAAARRRTSGPRLLNARRRRAGRGSCAKHRAVELTPITRHDAGSNRCRAVSSALTGPRAGSPPPGARSRPGSGSARPTRRWLPGRRR